MKSEHGARYSAVLTEDSKAIEVIDLGGGEHCTVTNDAENVVRELAAHFGLEGRRIVYRDSEGQWDELLHDGARFMGFAAAREYQPQERRLSEAECDFVRWLIRRSLNS